MASVATPYLPEWLTYCVVKLPGHRTSGCIFRAPSMAGEPTDWLHAQVAVVEHQHRIMIEAVENHMPEALVCPCCLVPPQAVSLG